MQQEELATPYDLDWFLCQLQEAFDQVGVDVIQYVYSEPGNKYAVVFVDYLTKWVEVFVTADQIALTIALTIAWLFAENVISRHGVPQELLSNRGANFLLSLIQEVCKVMGVHKLNTTAYYPQGDGLVERFNRTLTEMLLRRVERTGTRRSPVFCLPIGPASRS